MSNEWKMVPVELLERILGCISYGEADELKALLAAAPVPPAGGVQFVGYPPVPEDRKLPPAGDVEVLAWLVNNGTRSNGAFVNDPRGWAHGYEVTKLVDLAHATRLTADVDRWHDICVERTAERDGLLAELNIYRRQVQLLNEAGEFLDDVSQGVEDKLRAEKAALQSELTKARNEISRLGKGND